MTKWITQSHLISDSEGRRCENICKKNCKKNICTQGMYNDRRNYKSTIRNWGSDVWSINLMDYEYTYEFVARMQMVSVVSMLQASACNTDTTPNQPHRNSNTHRTKNNTTNVVIQQNSRKLLMMGILMSETCWAHKKWNKIATGIKLVFYF